MKTRALLLASTLFSAFTLLHAQQPAEQQPSSPPSLGPANPDSPLDGQMKILARGAKQLSLQVADPSKQQETITLLETLKKAANDAKTLEPRKTASVLQADRERFLADYRAGIERLSETFNQIEETVKAGHYDQSLALLSSLQTIKKEGHKQFKQD